MNDFTTLPIDSRLLDEHDAKKRIARKALSFIPEHGFIYLDTGSTTLSLALELKIYLVIRSLQIQFLY